MKQTQPLVKKSGFVVLVGRSNVGKSTLLNNLVGTKIAITSEKPQTTRQAIKGILTEPRGQVVFVDTPGIFHNAKDLITQKLNESVRESLHGIDLVLYVVDPTRAIGNEERELLRMLENIPKEKKLLVVNKHDLKDRPFEHEYEREASQFAEVFSVSALQSRGLKELKSKIFELLPEGEPYFPEYQFTTLEHKEWLGEIIREKVFQYLHQEIPYNVHVEVKFVEENADEAIIEADVLTTNNRHKGMIIGSGAHKIRDIGTAARKELEVALNRKVTVKLNVEVDEDWPKRFAGGVTA